MVAMTSFHTKSAAVWRVNAKRPPAPMQQHPPFPDLQCICNFVGYFVAHLLWNMLCGLQVLLVAATVMMGVWMGVYGVGFDWNGTPKEQFSYHPLLMFIGLVFLYGNGQQNYAV